MVRQVLVTDAQEVERDERRRCLAREHAHARLGGMDPLLQRVEVETRLAGDHDLAVDDDPIGQLALERVDQLGEVARHRAFVAATELDLVTVPEHDAPEAVPLGFEHEVGAIGQRLERADRLRQHRLDRRTERQFHRSQDYEHRDRTSL